MIQPFFLPMRTSPCSGAPTITDVQISKISSPACPGSNVYRVTVTLSASLPANFELKYYWCFAGSGCPPSFRSPAQTGLTKDFTESYASSGGTDVSPMYANAKVELVPAGSDLVCDSYSATQFTDNNVHFCE